MSSIISRLRFFLVMPAMLVLAAISVVMISGSAGVAAVTSEQNCWSALTAPASPGQQIELDDVSALPNGEVWAVGSQHTGGVNFGGLVLHFDGSAWRRVEGPFGTGRLEAVEAITPDNVWVVGSTVRDQMIYTHIIHWDGSTWNVVPSPNPGADGNGLAAISALSPNDIWAAGSTVPSRSSAQPLFLHWDGQAWTERPGPNITGMSTISGIAAVSANDVWAVGTSNSSLYAMVMHWDGARWEANESVLGLELAELSDITALSANDIWAVGRTHQIKGSSTLAMHWDGTRWTRVPTPLYGSRQPVFAYSSLRGVAAISPNDIWAVGAWGDRNTEYLPDQPFVLHWNGSYWGIAHESFPARSASLESVSIANGKAVAVGSYMPREVNEGRGLIMRQGDAPCLIPSPTLTPTYAQPLTPIVTETPGGPPLPTAVVPLNPPVPVPGNGSRTFPETGKTMTGVFLDYWNKHGGLPQQGYPISNVIGEVSDLNRQLYTMQYTERAIFEYHPENAKPYDVLLSHLGRFQLRNRYPAGTPVQTPNDQAGSILFKETGKRLGGAFLKYWRENGGLMQQGFPITDEFTEVSELDRKPYTVQYFERAVFEYHPELRGTQYEVLLSQLGTYRWREKYGQNPPIPPTPGPTTGPTITPLARGVIGRAVANNRYLFWIDDNRPTYSIYGYDWEQKSTFLVTDRPGFKFSLATDDKTLVWGEGDVEGQAGIRGYDILNRTEFVAVQPQSPSTISEDSMVIDEAMLYYVGNIGGRYGIIARNIAIGQENLVVEYGRNPVIWGDTMVWSKEVATCPGSQPPCSFEQELYVRKANNDRLLTRASGQEHFTEYDVWGDHVVWKSPSLSQESNPPNAYRISTASNNRLSDLNGSRPIINDMLVAWGSTTGSENGTWSLKLHNLSLAQTIDYVPRTGAYTEAQAFIGQRAVAYTVGGGGHPLMGKGDLYVVNLTARP